MDSAFMTALVDDTHALKSQGLFKKERVITSPQQGSVHLDSGDDVINLCANNYLGLANHPDVIAAAHAALDRYGFGMASVRFICGTLDIHKELEHRIARFLGTDDAILYAAAFDANGGLFETLLGPEDAVISDALNHASIIDGIRLCKAQRFRYANNDMDDLAAKLDEASNCRRKIIATDGVFSMDGTVAKLHTICDLAEKQNALVMIDDCHSTGFLGDGGRGTHEYRDVMGRVDIITGTLGKALGGASGGFTAARKPIVDWLRQRSRPYLFSNTVAPVIVAASIKVLDLIESSDALRVKLWNNTRYFRAGIEKLGFDVTPGDHPIIPVMLGDAKLAARMAERLLENGVYVIGFSFPVVPKGKARIRTQMSAALDQSQLDTALAAFGRVGKELGITGG